MKKTLYMRFFCFLARTFVARKPQALYEEKPEEGECGIYLANHSGLNGPANMYLYFDRPKKIWLIHYVLEKDKIEYFIFQDFFSGKVRKHQKAWRLLSKIVAVLLRPLLEQADGIPVFHGERSRETMQNTVEALDAGNNIVIFPESPRKFSQYVNELYTGFADIGRLYYEHTGKKLKFYPTYVSTELRTIFYGKPTEYQPENEPTAEKQRIADFVRDGIDRIAAAAPNHTPVPFCTKEWYDAHGEHIEHMSGYWKQF